MSKKLPIVLAIFGICFLASAIGYYFYTNYYRPARVTLPSALENIEFPSEPTQYPAGWPDDLKFPEGLVLVDSTSGTLPESTTTGWSAKLRYQGKPSDATKLISAFFEEKGWAVSQETQLESGGFSLILEREQGSGIIIVDTDPNDASATLVIATIFPKSN
jgi:hypothetical protein